MQLEATATKPVVTRMKRAHGHLATVIRMLEEGADCEDVLTQLAAVNKALSRAGFALVATGMEQCLLDGSDLDGAQRARMEKLFLSLA
ncbi:metal-sensitive transcriptional regulator [uncultured Nocardioides sp.]|uniref:metal-sensitive transcriptional regulator n=1 Tax=uncultured Nocardioides sp. TaxID=198441 RepID=UPI001DE5EF8D|nr:metal-sensitive transcriptional regulator [uncultured Nocardioides sp.]MBU2073150.1 metal-sensitive transcriptional regulator [Actinomycetota bacterium]MBU2111843.1 metal-sensitive transcriptional regulator [Actinomycetota bacterium]